jgi:hypothetical protein
MSRSWSPDCEYWWDDLPCRHRPYRDVTVISNVTILGQSGGRLGDNLLIGCDCIARVRSSSLAEHGGLVARKGRTFVELRLNLTIELPNGPAAAKRFAFIEGAGLRISYCE